MPMTMCPECQAEGTCYHRGDMPNGGPSYSDLYEFECLKCPYRESREVFAGDTTGFGTDWHYTTCPFCGK
jgi:hypothetical protein